MVDEHQSFFQEEKRRAEARKEISEFVTHPRPLAASWAARELTHAKSLQRGG